MKRVGATRKHGFSLVELIVVISIIMVITALSVPTVGQLVGAHRIGQASGVFAGAFSGARQLAVTWSRPVSVWLVGTGPDAVSGVITVMHQDNGSRQLMGRLTKLPDATAVSTVSALSPALTLLASSGTNAPRLPLGANYFYRAVEFRPDGSLAHSGADLFLTVVAERDVQNPTPSNYATIALERRTGAFRVFRP